MRVLMSSACVPVVASASAPMSVAAMSVCVPVVFTVLSCRGSRHFHDVVGLPFGYLATVNARIATPHIAVLAAYRLELHLLRKLPDSSRAGRRCCVPSPYRWIFARLAEDPPPHPLPCSQLRLASRRAFQSR